MGQERSLYQVLQVDPAAEPEILEAAYRRLARKYHPDVSRSPDAERRMKEINAAYEVLCDRLRRAAYDRQLFEQVAHARSVEHERPPEPRWADRDQDEWDERDEPAMLACRQHPQSAAVGSCIDCGAGLCSWCFERFQPSSCPACVLAWVRQRRSQLMLHPSWFFGVLLVLSWLFLQLDRSSLMPQVSLTVVAIELAVMYVLASFPSGFGLVNLVLDENEPIILLLALALGPVVAPFRIGKALRDLRRLGRLAALARSPG